MNHDRRTFLKTTSLVAAMAAASLPGTGAVAQGPKTGANTAAKTSEPKELPKGLTFATLRRGDGFGLGLRTDRGVLDVTAAEQDFHEGAPTTIDAVLQGQGDVNGLKRLADKARASTAAERYFVATDKADFGPCVTNPEKIVCIGLNYRRHAAETGNPVPKQPILFNKYNTALNYHGGTIGVSEEDAQKFDYEAELVIVMGRRARNVSEADALNYIFGYATGNDFTRARPAVALEPMDAGQEPGRLGAGRAVARHRRPGGRRQPEDRVPGQRRRAPIVEHVRHGVQLQAARELCLEIHDPEARRHHLHRDARGRDLRLPEGQAGLAQGRRHARHLHREARRLELHR